MATRPKLRGGSERAAGILADVLARAESTLRRQAARHATRPGDADDALQEAYARFLRRYDGEPGPDATRWLMTTVKRCAWEIDRSPERRHAACAELTTTDACHPVSAPVCAPCQRPGPLERAELACDLAALDDLKPDERTALLLLGLGCTYREIAARENWTYTKVNRCVAEGRAALRARREGGEDVRPDP